MIDKLFELASLAGKTAIKEVVVSPVKNGLRVIASSPDETVAVNITSEGNELGIKNPIGVTNITNISKYMTILGSLPKVTIKENRLTFSKGKKRVTSLIKEPEYIKSNVSEKRYNEIKAALSGGETITLKVEDIKKIKGYVSTIGVDNFTMAIKDSEVIIEVGNENTDTITDVLELDTKVKVPVKITLGQSFFDATERLATTFDMTVKDNKPVAIISECPAFRYEALVALFG